MNLMHKHDTKFLEVFFFETSIDETEPSGIPDKTFHHTGQIYLSKYLRFQSFRASAIDSRFQRKFNLLFFFGK